MKKIKREAKFIIHMNKIAATLPFEILVPLTKSVILFIIKKL